MQRLDLPLTSGQLVVVEPETEAEKISRLEAELAASHARERELRAYLNNVDRLIRRVLYLTSGLKGPLVAFAAALALGLLFSATPTGRLVADVLDDVWDDVEQVLDRPRHSRPRGDGPSRAPLTLVGPSRSRKAPPPAAPSSPSSPVPVAAPDLDLAEDVERPEAPASLQDQSGNDGGTADPVVAQLRHPAQDVQGQDQQGTLASAQRLVPRSPARVPARNPRHQLEQGL